MGRRFTAEIGAGDVNHLSGSDLFGGSLELRDNGAIGGDFIAGNANNHKTKLELFQIVLPLQTLINRNEHIEVLFSKSK